MRKQCLLQGFTVYDVYDVKWAQPDFKWYANELLSLNNNYLKFN